MNKEEKIQMIKRLQAEVTECIKNHQYEEALHKMDQILELVPTLEKVRQLKQKIEQKVQLLSEKKGTKPQSISPEEEDTQVAETITGMEKAESESPVDSKVTEEGEKVEEEQPSVEEMLSEPQTPGMKEEKKEDFSVEELEEFISSQEKEEAIPEKEEGYQDSMLEEILEKQEKITEDLKEEEFVLAGSDQENEPLSEEDKLLLDELAKPVKEEEEEFFGSFDKGPEKTPEEEDQVKPDIEFSRIMEQAIESEDKAEISDRFALNMDEGKPAVTTPGTIETEPEEIDEKHIDQKLKELLGESAEEPAIKATPKYEVDHSSGIPVVKGGKRKEKLEYEFKISEEPAEISADRRLSGTSERPISMDQTFEDASRKGFKISLIPQALGFALNLERMLLLTLGLLATLAISVTLSSIVKGIVGKMVTAIISSSLITFFLTFIAYTIWLQLRDGVKGNFRKFLGTFASQHGPAAITFWIVYSVVISALLMVVFLLFQTFKLGSVGSLVYSVLSLPSFIVLATAVLLIMFSPLASFIVPALIVVEKTGIWTTFSETVRLLKHRLFSILWGFLYTQLISVFVIVILFYLYLFSMGLLLAFGFFAGGTAFMQIFSAVPAVLLLPLTTIARLMGLGMMPMVSGGTTTVAGTIFMIMLFIGIMFLVAIPMIFQTGGGVITYLSLKDKRDLFRDE